MLKYCGRWKFVRNLYLSIRYWVVGKKFVPYRSHHKISGCETTKYSATNQVPVLNNFLLKYEEIKIWRKFWKYFGFIFGAGFWPVFFNLIKILILQFSKKFLHVCHYHFFFKSHFSLTYNQIWPSPFVHDHQST